MRKTKKWENIFWLQNGAIRGLQIEEGFRDCKLGQERLKIEAALEISNRAKEISNQGIDYKSGQEGFPIRAGIINRWRTCYVFKIFDQGCFGHF